MTANSNENLSTIFFIYILSRLRCSCKRVLLKYLAANLHEHSVHPPFFKKGGLTGSQFLEGVAGN